jgi:bis(5'-nucleosyl)-tetraphosphatase (symmetrical)
MDYAIGDVQGCYSKLQQLLDLIEFDEKKDTLWFTGDLVNRGPESLETLRFIKKLGPKHRIVLGNHDLHLLAMLHDTHSGWPDDTLDEILKANDREEITAWLLEQPLFFHDEASGYSMVHAGLAPTWDIEKAQHLNIEIQNILKSATVKNFFKEMYGNTPAAWQDDLTGYARLRCITNFFTRVRFCFLDGRMSFADTDTDIVPWFKHPERKTTQNKIIFGHWAQLAGQTDTPNTFALDTGCVWGYALTAMRMSDEKRFAVSCHSS